MACGSPDTMKAVQVATFGGPEELRVQTIPVPSVGDDDVLVRVFAAGVNPVETYIRAGTYANLPALPFTPGNDGAGIIEQVGVNVKTKKIGDRVYIGKAKTGTYAEYTVCDGASVYSIPDSVTFEQGASIGVAFTTAYRALFVVAQARPGQIVLVHGASGGVGIAAVQWCVSRGIRVVGTAGTEAGVQLVLAQGAEAAFNHREAGYTEAAKAHTGGAGFDVIVEMLANVNLDADTDMVALGGKIAIVGNRGRTEIDPRRLMGKEACVLGVMNSRTTPSQAAEANAAVMGGLKTGALSPIVGPAFPLLEAPAAHVEVLEHSSGAAGKVVLSIL